MNPYEEMAELLETCTCAGPAKEEHIVSAEMELSCQFPSDYKRFLQEFGGCLCNGFEIAGLFEAEDPDEPPLWSDLVASTRQKRRFSGGQIPDEYIAVSTDGGEYVFYLDTSSGDGCCPVVAMGPGVDELVVAPSFTEFVLRYSSGTIDFESLGT